MESNNEQSGTEQAQSEHEAPSGPDMNGKAPQPGEPAGQPADVAQQEPAAASEAASAAGEATDEAASEPSAPDTPGMAIGPYDVLRRLPDRDGHTVYLATLRESAQAPTEAEAAPRVCYLLVEGAQGDHATAGALAALGLHHPRLCAPRAVVAHERHEYLAIEMVCDAETHLPTAADEGARLSAEDSLRAGAGLADALAYLHRNGVAHGHIAPRTVLVLDGRAYLGGIEEASRVGAGEESAARFARDANALACSLETLAGLPATPPSDESAAQVLVREIAARGVVDGFATADEVNAACTAALERTLQLPPLGEEPAQNVWLVLRTGAATSIGRVRAQNQDAASVMHFDIHDDVLFGMPQALALVADGMGGEAHGELASRIAARIISAELARAYFLPALAVPATAALTEDVEPQTGQGGVRELAEALVRAVEQANHQVRTLGERLGQATGTTLTALAVRGTHAVLAHVGDSRAYLLHGETLMRLTEDHSLMARLEAMDHPLLHDPAFFMSRSVLYRSLGQEDDAQPDLLDLPLSPGDRVLLCSDGLWDELDDQTIGVTLATATDPETCARQLVEMANEAGGHDNSTAVVLFVGERPIDSAPNRSEGDKADLEEAPEEKVSSPAPSGTE